MIISKQICSYCSNESEIPQEFQEREPSSNSTQETGSNTTVVFSANSSQNSLHTFRIGGGFFVGVEFKYANINVNSTSGSKVTPTEHFYCKDEDLKLPRVSFAVILCHSFEISLEIVPSPHGLLFSFWTIDISFLDNDFTQILLNLQTWAVTWLA